jgi:hypothetical protein
LYDHFASGLIGDDQWLLPFYRNPEALRFSQWVYRNMVVEDIAVGLLTNVFSEIYNHAEYHLALEAFRNYLTNMTDIPKPRHESLLDYIRVHVEDNTEADHFLLVSRSLTEYLDATGEQLNFVVAEKLFRAYLQRVGAVMQALAGDMLSEHRRYTAAGQSSIGVVTTSLSRSGAVPEPVGAVA